MELFSNPKLLLVLSDISFHVQTITNRPSIPSALYLSRSGSIEDYPHLFEESVGVPDALIYPSNDTSSNRILLDMLERKLLEELSWNPLSILEFEDPNDLDHIYLVSHKEASHGLGRFIDASPIGLFKFNLEKLISNKHIPYIKHTKTVRLLLLKEYQLLKAQLAQLNQVLQASTTELDAQKLSNRNIKKDLELTKKTLQLLNTQSEKFSVMCEFCRERKKDMLIAPCFHVMACKECLTIRIPTSDPGVPVEGSVCHLCSNPVTEVRQLFYS